MRVWISREILRCPDLLVRVGDQLVCMLDVFMFIFMHSILDLVSGFNIDICGLMVSFLVCVDVSPNLPPGHWSRVVTVPPATASAMAPSESSQKGPP